VQKITGSHRSHINFFVTKILKTRRFMNGGGMVGLPAGGKVLNFTIVKSPSGIFAFINTQIIPSAAKLSHHKLF